MTGDQGEVGMAQGPGAAWQTAKLASHPKQSSGHKRSASCSKRGESILGLAGTAQKYTITFYLSLQ